MVYLEGANVVLTPSKCYGGRAVYIGLVRIIVLGVPGLVEITQHRMGNFPN